MSAYALPFRPVFNWNSHLYPMRLRNVVITPKTLVTSASYALGLTLANGSVKAAISASLTGTFAKFAIDQTREAMKVYDVPHVVEFGKTFGVEIHSDARSISVPNMKIGRKLGYLFANTGKQRLTSGKLGLGFELSVSVSVTLADAKTRLFEDAFGDARLLEAGQSLLSLPRDDSESANVESDVDSLDIMRELLGLLPVA